MCTEHKICVCCVSLQIWLNFFSGFAKYLAHTSSATSYTWDACRQAKFSAHTTSHAPGVPILPYCSIQYTQLSYYCVTNM